MKLVLKLAKLQTITRDKRTPSNTEHTKTGLTNVSTVTLLSLKFYSSFFYYTDGATT